MKTGAIVYVAGSEKMKDDFDVERAVRRLNLKADRIEVVTATRTEKEILEVP
ncbi:MAG: hypothetical protein JRJ08_04435, partial [Deltaproteobacteria bacterium]|nr:hypothetical protein [Deltaproteobacteria bacterium]